MVWPVAAAAIVSAAALILIQPKNTQSIDKLLFQADIFKQVIDEAKQNFSATLTNFSATLANFSASLSASLDNFSASLDDFSASLDNFSAGLKEIDYKIDYLYKKAHDAEISLDLAKDCSVRVQVSPPHRQQNDDTKQGWSAGTLVSIGDDDTTKYVLTNRRVIVDLNHNHSCYRGIESVFRRGHVAVETVQVEEALVSTVDDIDLALIPVLHADGQEDDGRYYCTVAKNKQGLALSEKLVAFLPAEDEHSERLFTAKIRVMDHTRPLIGGTFGWKTNGGHSGLGYFADGAVVLVHCKFAHVAAGDPLAEAVDASKAHNSGIFKSIRELEYQRCAK